MAAGCRRVDGLGTGVDTVVVVVVAVGISMISMVDVVAAYPPSHLSFHQIPPLQVPLTS